MINPRLTFTCNICGEFNDVEISALQRDGRSCSTCGSSVRFRWVIHSLSCFLFGKSLLLSEFPYSPEIKGIGLSDEPMYAVELAKRVGYVNTFYHREPKLDIKDLNYGSANSLDFIIASEVFEHIPYPVQPAFDNLYRLLKPGGVVLFSVPWRPAGYTVEHFGALYEWQIVDWRDSKILINRTEGDSWEVFSELQFHGGPGETLEMRLFSKTGLADNFKAAKLTVEFVRSSFLQHGVVFVDPWSLPCTAIKPVLADTAEDSPGTVSNHSQESRNEIRTLYNELDRLTAWAELLDKKSLGLERELLHAATKQNLAKNSKWVKLGRRFGFGPRL